LPPICDEEERGERSFQVVAWVRHYGWGTTPGKLRWARMVLVIGVLLAGVFAVYAATAR
jgi:hypothetical protein